MPARATPRARSAKPAVARGATPRALAPLAPEPRHAWRVALALAVLAWLLAFLPQLVLGRVFTLGDAGSFRPYAELSRARWRAAHVRTYWNPYTFLGIDAVASLADSR